MNYTDEMNTINECLEGWKCKGQDGIIAAYSILDYAQWIDKIDFDQAKDIMYRFVEAVLHPEWE